MGQELDGEQLTRNEVTGHGKFLRYYFKSCEVEKTALINKLKNDSHIKDLVYTYLGTSNIEVSVESWISYGKDSPDFRELSEAAQLFHFDYDSFNFLKLFVFVSDVDDQNGPHQYFIESHKKFPFVNEELSSIPTYFRIEDDHLEKMYGSDKMKTFELSAGSILLEDTSGFHRGLPLQTGKTREVIVLTYKDVDFSRLRNEN
ncbi:phytanoyl-CoA dioxygenase family protein [Synechococcus sp. N19]|uniref:phytanoyl-CoA dioxygenase family protein n=1 Tax=Synechococcus sp. N19 TaxID=2575512 RepID=UPI001A7E0F96|nr:phytanoyl-CoA dioxygenase family protein [Synechococcus sp. N19]